jgi:hypothetical protein
VSGGLSLRPGRQVVAEVDVSGEKYLLNLLKEGSLSATGDEIAEAIRSGGLWVDHQAWRPAASSEIAIIGEIRDGVPWYRVNVSCGYDLHCLCPTLERAIEMAGLFQQLIVKLDEQIGMPAEERASEGKGDASST